LALAESVVALEIAASVAAWVEIRFVAASAFAGATGFRCHTSLRERSMKME
jgi:hypothetical protein